MQARKNILEKLLNPKVAYSLALLVILLGAVKLFNFSTYQEEDKVKHQQNFNRDYRIYSVALPEQLDLAGEKVPLSDLDTRERLDREMHVNTYWQSQSILLMKRANRWFPVIEPILQKNGVPDDFKYLAIIESGFTNVVSPAGATGFWQFMKPAAENYGLEINEEVDERYNVEKSTEAACKYLKDSYKKFGSWTLAAASYNMGVGGVNNQMKRQKAKNYYDLLLPTETSRYVFRILALKEIYSNPEKYGFNVRNKDLYPPIETYTVQIDTGVSQLADFAQHLGINYKILKEHNPWLRDNFLTNKDGKTYSIKVPMAGYYEIQEPQE